MFKLYKFKTFKKKSNDKKCNLPKSPRFKLMNVRQYMGGKRPGVAQRVGRGVALLFHDRGTRRG